MAQDNLAWSVCPSCDVPLVFGVADPFERVECRRCRYRFRTLESKPFGREEWEQNDHHHLLYACVWLSDRVTFRKLRLSACTVGRRLLERKPIAWLFEAVEAGEWWADAGQPQWKATEIRRKLERKQRWSFFIDSASLWIAMACIDEASRCVSSTGTASGMPDQLSTHFADACRELFPNPFIPLTWNPDWLTSTVRDIAAHIYNAHEFYSMPILADALQDAGCDDEQILTHCRGNRPHARGCWVLDAILGKT